MEKTGYDDKKNDKKEFNKPKVYSEEEEESDEDENDNFDYEDLENTKMKDTGSNDYEKELNYCGICGPTSDETILFFQLELNFIYECKNCFFNTRPRVICNLCGIITFKEFKKQHLYAENDIHPLKNHKWVVIKSLDVIKPFCLFDNDYVPRMISPVPEEKK
jgi:hypothetical protein